MHSKSELGANEVAFCLETNEAIPADKALFFCSELVRIARLRRHFGPDAVIEIVEAGRGSFWVKLMVAGSALANVATISAFALDIVDRHLQRTERMPMCTARMMVDNGVTKLTAMTCTGSYEALREQVPAVRAILDKRDSDERQVRVSRQSGGQLVTEDGRLVELENGPVVFGTVSVPAASVRYLDQPTPDDKAWPPGMMPTGEARLAQRRLTVTLMGAFERDADGTYFFKSGSSVFECEFALGLDASPPLNEPVSVTAELDPSRPNLIRMVAMAA